MADSSSLAKQFKNRHSGLEPASAAQGCANAAERMDARPPWMAGVQTMQEHFSAESGQSKFNYL